MLSRLLSERIIRLSSLTCSQSRPTAIADSPFEAGGLSSISGSKASTTIKKLISAGGAVNFHPPVFPRLLVTNPERFSSCRIWAKKLGGIDSLSAISSDRTTDWPSCFLARCTIARLA